MWVKLDDQFFNHPKARAAGLPGRALFVASLCYCARFLTDGRLPKDAVPLVLSEASVTRGVVTKLADLGWWVDCGDYYEVHDFLDYNPTRAEVEGQRDGARVRMQRQRNMQGTFAARSDEPSGERTTKVHPTRPRPPKRQTRARGDERFRDDFEALWQHYPRRIAKQDAFRAYSARRHEGLDADTLLKATKGYEAACATETTLERFTMHGATFFGPNERWKDYLEPPKPSRNGRVDFDALT